MSIQTATSPLEDYLRSLRSDVTRKHYQYILRRMLGEPDAWVEKAKADRHFIEGFLLDFIAKERTGPKKKAGSTVRARVIVVKSFLDFHEVMFNWKKVRNSLPQGNYAAHDRAPTIEELRALAKYCGVRERMVLSMMVSAGFRLGAWKYLAVGDVEFLPSGLGRVTIYRGEPEQYQTFISAEATAAVKEYVAARELVGEKVTSSSAIIRDRWAYESLIPKTRGNHGRWRHPENEGEAEDKVSVSREFESPEVPHSMTERSIQSMFLRLWVRSGVRKYGDGRGKFKMVHGLRKFFKTAASKAGLQWEDQEVLLGHYLNYYKPTLEHLEQVYAKLEPYVTLSEAAEAKAALKANDKEHEADWARTRLEVLELRQQNDKLQRAIAEVLPLLEGLRVQSESKPKRK